ncbi:IrrE-like protein [Gordonia phage Lton]|nr:IrrE-like protein [Gordonia phage Lton]
MFNPWRYLAEHHPQVKVVWTRLPGAVRAVTDGRTIWMDERLCQVQRRIAVCHETFHIERGIIPADSFEERRVEVLTAQRMIALDDLVEALRWNRAPTEAALADMLWVEPATVRTRLAHLEPWELAHIENKLDLDWGVA